MVIHGESENDLLAGFLHPILGMDHLLAMVAVGLVSTQLGGNNVIRVPLTFVSAMLIGGLAGLFGFLFPWTEYGISLSVLLLGGAILVANRITPQIVMMCVAIFGLYHGNAHGIEVPGTIDTTLVLVIYFAGFLCSTVGLHLVGALLGMILNRSRTRVIWFRLAGIILLVIGGYLTSTL